LLLAVLDLVARSVITSPLIEVTKDLIELNELFNGYWRRVVPLGKTSSIAFPFSRLHNEPFWKLLPILGGEINAAVINNISNVTQLRKVALGAHLDDDLFILLQNAENRNALRETLLQSCFSEQGKARLAGQAQINAEAYDYSQELARKAHFPKVEEALAVFRPAARYQGFRRIVVNSYDHRCALCGVRIVTPEGHTVVDAAHIVPWRKTQNDDIRNGMALCKLCHWSFDEGMMGLSDNYDVIVSHQITANPNVPGFLVTLSGRGAILPTDRVLWPELEYLKEHRREWRL
jgi:putative restriction endonuclease